MKLWTLILSLVVLLAGSVSAQSVMTDQLYGVNSALAIKAPATVATTANINLQGLLVIDGVLVSTTSRVLVKDQANLTQNGIYTPSVGTWQRTVDATNSRNLTNGTLTYVVQGTQNGSTFWQLSVSDQPISIGSTTLSFSQPNLAGGGTTITSATGLIVSPSWAIVGLTLGELFKYQVDVREMGAICDGAAHSGNLTAGQLALDVARTISGVSVILAPPNHVCVYGTDTTLNTESPLKYVSNTNIVFAGKALHNINNGDLFLLEGLNDDLTDTTFQENVNIIGLPGSMIDTVSRTTSQSRKYVGVTNTKNVNVEGLVVSGTTSVGSFGLQIRNAENFRVLNNIVKMFPVFPAASGGDAFHIHGNTSGTQLVQGNTFYGDDDACSQTIEGTTMAGRKQDGVTWIGNYCATYRNSGLKMYTDVTGTIVNSKWIGNTFTVWGPPGEDGNCFKIEENGRGTISNTIIADNVFDCPRGEKNTGAGAGPFGTVTGDNPNTIFNTLFSNNVYSGWQYRGVELVGGINGVTFDGGYIVNYQGTSVTVPATSVQAVSRTSANTQTWYFTSGTDLSGVTANTSYFVSPTTGTTAYNYRGGYITGVFDASDTVTIEANGVTAAEDQSFPATINAAINWMPGYFFYHRDAQNVTIQNMRQIGGPQFTFLTTASGASATTAIYRNNIIRGANGRIIMQLGAGNGAWLEGNQCQDCFGGQFIQEASAMTSGTTINNSDLGVSTTNRVSYVLSSTNYRNKYNNQGTNGDKFDFYRFGLVSTSNVTAVSATIQNLGVSQSLVVSGTISTTFAGATSRTMCVQPNGLVYVSPTC